MRLLEPTLMSKGQLTIPKSIRDYLKLETVDKTEFIIDAQGQIIMAAKTLKIDEIFGMIERKKGVTIEDMNRAIEKRILSRNNLDLRH